MSLKDYIKIYDETLPVETVVSIIKWAQNTNQNFTEGTVGDKGDLVKDIRNVSILPLNIWNSKTKTKIHWYNLLISILRKKIITYEEDINLKCYTEKFDDLSILKYEVGQGYKKHVDHFAKIPRTLSFILLLNNDYKGGELYFYNSDGSIMKKIDNIPGRLIVWPSNFLYPHSVGEVKEGTRFSIVSWVL